MIRLSPYKNAAPRLSGLMLCAVWLVFGCASEPEQPRSSITDQQRQTASPRVRAYLVKAYEHYNEGAYRTALAYTDSAAHLEAGLTDLHFLRGQIYTAVNLYDKANKEYRRVLAEDSTYQGAWLNLGNNAARRGLNRRALSRYQRELELHPTASAWVAAGRAYKNLRKPDSSRFAYRQALRLDSVYAPAHIMLSELYDEGGHLDSALHHAREAYRVNPENLGYQYKVGALLVRLDRTDEALQPLRAVAEQNSLHYGAHYNLGMALQQLGRSAEAERYLTKADSLQRLQAHLRRLERAARDNPDNALAWAELGDALRRVDRMKGARNAYRRALSIAPKSIVLQNNVANIALMQGDYDEARDRYRAILKQDSSNTDVWLNLGVVQARMGNMEAARQAWQTVLAYDEGHAAAQTYLDKYGNER